MAAAGVQTSEETSSDTRPEPSPKAPKDKASHVAFRQFMEARNAGKAKAKPVNAAPAFRPVRPTPERLIKADHPLRTANGAYRVPAPVERLRDRGGLDPKPRINEGMYAAALSLAASFYFSGLAEHIKSQDLSGVGGGTTTASSYMPVSEFAAHHRQKFLAACKAMGWYEAHPLRGAGRLVVEVICRERSLRDVAQGFFPKTRTESAQSAALDRMREGLFLLATHWKMI